MKVLRIGLIFFGFFLIPIIVSGQEWIQPEIEIAGDCKVLLFDRGHEGNTLISLSDFSLVGEMPVEGVEISITGETKSGDRVPPYLLFPYENDACVERLDDFRIKLKPRCWNSEVVIVFSDGMDRISVCSGMAERLGYSLSPIVGVNAKDKDADADSSPGCFDKVRLNIDDSWSTTRLESDFSLCKEWILNNAEKKLREGELEIVLMSDRKNEELSKFQQESFQGLTNWEVLIKKGSPKTKNIIVTDNIPNVTFLNGVKESGAITAIGNMLMQENDVSDVLLWFILGGNDVNPEFDRDRSIFFHEILGSYFEVITTKNYQDFSSHKDYFKNINICHSGIGDGGEVRVYPNPTSNKVFIELVNDRDETLECFVNLYCVGGKKLKRFGLNCESRLCKEILDISNLDSGVYTLRIEGWEAGNPTSYVHKIVVTK